MKNLFSLILFFACLSFVSAQGTYVVGSVTDGNGNPVTSVIGSIEYDDCNQTYTDTLFVNGDGIYDYFIANNCTQGSVLVTFYCTNGSQAINEAQGFFSPASPDVILDVVLDCSITTIDTCQIAMTVIPGDFAPWWTFVADAGVLPANTAYSWALPAGATLVDPNTASSNQVDIQFADVGTYTICANVMDLTSGDILCTECTTVAYPFGVNNNCNALFYQGDSLGYTILDGFVTGNAGPYTYAWYIDGNYVSANQYIELNNLAPGIYYTCLVATGTDGSICEYCEDILIEDSIGCFVGFDQINLPPTGGGVYQAWAQGTSANYTYEWLISNAFTTITVAGNTLDMSGYDYGTYNVCVTATGDNGEVCQSCQDIEFGVVDCTASFYQVDSLGYSVLNGFANGGVAPYTYGWFVDGNFVSSNQSLDLSNFDSSMYYICFLVTGADGNVCEYCEDVEIGSNNNQCWTGFNQTTTPNGGTTLQAWTQGSNTSYTYEWFIEGLPSTFPITGESLDLTNFAIPDGTYTICITATGANGEVCGDCQNITIGNVQDPCYVGFSQDGDAVYAWSQGSNGPFTYAWSDGSTGATLDLTGYLPGAYTLCVSVTDANGEVCEYCDVVYVNDIVDDCLDWNVIDLANAPCNFDYNPVCGCDGIEYVNACVAYYCYGILEWTDGPCDYTGGNGSGGNTDGSSTDSLCQITAEYFYYGEENATGGYDMFFFGFGVDADEYIWDMGDGTTYTGEVVNHTYGVNVFDTIQAYTACLTTFNYTDSCTATICETIILDSTPNGFIGGDVVEGQNLVGGGQVEKLSNTDGDPIAEATVELQDVNGNIIATTTTDANGSYSFSGLQFGDYFVHVNIDGATHTPDLIQLRPVLQTVTNNSYEVTNGQIVSGIDGVSFASGINVAPNPTSGTLNIALELASNVEINVMVTDVLGKVVSQEVNNYTAGIQLIELNLENLVSGIYLVSLQSSGEVYTTKVLKQ